MLKYLDSGNDGDPKYIEENGSFSIQLNGENYMGLFSKLFGGKSKVKVSENSVKLTDVRCPHCGNTMYTTSQIGKIFGPLLSLGDDDFSRNVFRIQLDVFIGRPMRWLPKTSDTG